MVEHIEYSRDHDGRKWLLCARENASNQTWKSTYYTCSYITHVLISKDNIWVCFHVPDGLRLSDACSNVKYSREMMSMKEEGFTQTCPTRLSL